MLRLIDQWWRNDYIIDDILRRKGQKSLIGEGFYCKERLYEVLPIQTIEFGEYPFEEADFFQVCVLQPFEVRNFDFSRMEI